MKAAILLRWPQAKRHRFAELIAARFSGVTVTTADDVAAARLELKGAAVFLGFGNGLPADFFAGADDLQLVQILGTGTTGIADNPSLGNAVSVASVRGLHGTALSEAALMFIFSFARGYAQSVRNQASGVWGEQSVRFVAGSTLGIFGTGLIAGDLARRARALGMRVEAITRTPRELPEYDRVWSREEMIEAVAGFDHFVLLAPLDPSTVGAIDAAVLAAMKPTASLINIGRAGLVDYEALATALHDGRLAHAGLDLFPEMPLPAGHPLWTLPGVEITPHISGDHPTYADEAFAQFEPNLARVFAGATHELVNPVSRS